MTKGSRRGGRSDDHKPISCGLLTISRQPFDILSCVSSQTIEKCFLHRSVLWRSLYMLMSVPWDNFGAKIVKIRMCQFWRILHRTPRHQLGPRILFFLSIELENLYTVHTNPSSWLPEAVLFFKSKCVPLRKTFFKFSPFFTQTHRKLGPESSIMFRTTMCVMRGINPPAWGQKVPCLNFPGLWLDYWPFSK